MKMWKSILFGILTAILIAVMVVSVLAGQKYKERIECTGLKIEIIDNHINNFVLEEEIKELLDKEFGSCKGYLADSINLVKIEKVISTKSAVKDAIAYVSKDGLLNIKVTQQKPIARLQTRGGGYYINENGGLLPLQKNYTSHVLVVDGEIKAKPDPEWVQQVVNLIHLIQEHKKWENAIVQINVKKGGELVLIPREGKEKFLIGQPVRIEEKLRKIETYYSHIKPNIIDKHYEHIDLRYGKQIICK